MASRTFHLFTLNDGIDGMKRALAAKNITMLCVKKEQAKASFTIHWNNKKTTIILEECVSQDHPLANLGHVYSVVVTIPDDVLCDTLDLVLTMAFLRGGG